MGSRSRLTLATGLVLASVGLAACGGDAADSAAADEGGPTTVSVGYKPSTSYVPFALDATAGIFEEEGIDLELVESAGSSSADIPLILHDDFQIGLGSTHAVLLAISQGLPLKIIAPAMNNVTTDNGSQFAVLVMPDSGIETFKDLENKTVAVSALNNGFDLATQDSVRLDGGDPTTMKRVELAYGPQITALTNGDVNAIVTFEPFVSQAVAAGAVSIGDPSITSIGEGDQPITAFVAAAWAEKNPEVVEAFRRALGNAYDYANGHPDEARALAAEALGWTEDQAANLPLPEWDAEINEEYLQRDLEQLVQFGLLTDDKVPSISDIVVDAG
jgi:NitT/TauT family transport system substrate-binding protein